MTGRLVALNEKGYRIGEAHPKAKVTDADIALIFELREAGLTLGTIAAKFEVGKACIWKILQGMRRSETPMRWVRAKESGPRKVWVPPPPRSIKPPGPQAEDAETPGALLQRMLNQAWR